MIRAAIATKKKFGAVRLSETDKAVCENIAGRKWEEMWIGKSEGDTAAPLLETPEGGKYAILEEERQRLEQEIEQSKQSLH